MLPEIVEASGMPGHTLLQHFRDFKGTSPIRCLWTARYEKVREALHRAEPEEGVTDIAAKWGFTHMGRFSVDYSKRFRRNAVADAAQAAQRTGLAVEIESPPTPVEPLAFASEPVPCGGTILAFGLIDDAIFESRSGSIRPTWCWAASTHPAADRRRRHLFAGIEV